jgi:L-cysteine desulfidase
MSDAELFLDCLHAGVAPATGCTEPIAIAYAVAKALVYLEDATIQSITVRVSPNVMKNALAVMVPGVGELGLVVAAAAGAIAGRPEAGLDVIARISPAQLAAIKALAHSGKVHASMAPVEDDLYVAATVTTLAGVATVEIAGGHTAIFRVEKNGTRLVDRPKPAPHAHSARKTALQQVSLRRIWAFAVTVPLAEIAFMQEADTLNWALAEAGLQQDYGLQLGQSLVPKGAVVDLQTQIQAYTTAASDARMGGAAMPAMSNSGSGNQGITATLPVSVVARHVAAKQVDLLRALTLSHLTALYAHAFLPVLGPFCATDTAAMGAAVGCCYLLGMGYAGASKAVRNMAGDASGMVCDGAGASCALKVGTAVSSLYRAVNLAKQGVVVPATNGLVQADVDETIRGIGRLGTEGMQAVDATVLDIMQHKQAPRVTIKARQ